MKKLLIGFLTLASFSAFSSEVICIAQGELYATYFVSRKEYKVLCNDGTSETAAEELRMLYIPTGYAERKLNAYMEAKGLKNILTIEKTREDNLADWLSTTDKTLVFSNMENSNTEWAYATRNSGKTAGPSETVLYSFEVTLDSSDGASDKYSGYTKAEFKNFFTDMKYEKVIEGKTSKKSTTTKYLFQKK